MKFRGMCFCPVCEAGHARYFELERRVKQLLARAAVLGQEGCHEAARAMVSRAVGYERERSRINLRVRLGRCLREEPASA